VYSMPYKLAAIAVLIASAFTIGFIKGNARAEVEIQRAAAEAAEKIAELERINSEISNKVVTKYVEKVKTIKQKEYVYVDNAQKFVPSIHNMSTGWVYLHDVSAQNGDAESSKSSDGTSSGVKDNQAIGTIVQNYSICRQNAEQLIQLQQWIIENQQSVAESNKK
jgi:hypothetical protein